MIHYGHERRSEIKGLNPVHAELGVSSLSVYTAQKSQ